MRARIVGLLAVVAAVGCGGISEDVDATIATVRPVRGETVIDGDRTAVVSRPRVGQTLGTSESGLASLSLDLGPQLLMGEATELELTSDGVSLGHGHLFGEAQTGEHLVIQMGEMSLRASDSSLSIERSDSGDRVYVVRGEVAWTHGEQRGVVSSGEELVVDGDEVRILNATLWHDWTGGLARPGPSGESGPAGMGMLEARVPDEVGRARWPLVIRRLDVRVRIEDDLAITEVDQLFFNPASEMVEGLYRIRTPEGAVLQRFAVDRDDVLVDGYVREKAQARQAYERQVYRGSTLDPALLEWDAPGSYRARIYPIHPGETRRIVIRYAEWLRAPAGATARMYRYPMGEGGRAPHIQEFALSVDVEESGAQSVRAGMGAAVEDGAVRIRRSDFAPRSDFWLELVDETPSGQLAWRAQHVAPDREDDTPLPGEADERDYYFLPLILPATLGDAEPADAIDLVIVADVSAGTNRSHLELGRSVVESLTSHLGPEDRVAIVSSDLTIRQVVEGPAAALEAATPERIEALLDGLARVPAGGATDLGEAIGDAAELLDPERAGAVIYVGDGTPTVGEMRARGLLERLANLPNPVRLYAVAVGGDANLELLESLTRGGGLSLRVEERADAAHAALRLLAHASRPIAHDVAVALGDGVENVFPRGSMDAVLGGVYPVVGRIADEGPPSEVVVTGTINGEAFSETIAVETRATAESTDLRLRWASERLRQLLLEGGGREEIAELGTRYGLITPFTSYYVPSRDELNRMGTDALSLIDRPLLPIGEPRSDTTASEWALALPLSIVGCTFSRDSDTDDYAAEEAPEWLDEEDYEGGSGSRNEEGQMGAPAATETSNNRYAIQGAEDNADPNMAREQARTVGALGALGPQPRTGQQMPGRAAPAEPSAANGPMGNLNGDLVGDAVGTGGLGLRGAGGGGQGQGRFGAGSAGHGSQEEADEILAAPIEEAEPVAEAERRRRPRRRAGALIIDPFDATGGFDQPNDESAAHARRGRRAAEMQRAAGYALDNDATTVRSGLHSENQEIRIVTQIVHTTDVTAHRSRRCSDAAALALADRRALWQERLSNESNAAAWIRAYREAIRQCEARSWRDRRSFLNLMIARAGSVQNKLNLYRLLSSASARSYLRTRILRSVRRPEDLREVRRVFGLGSRVDWTLVEQILDRAPNDDAKVAAMRRLSMQYADSFELKLRLLALLERTERIAEADRLATRLRHDPRADAGVRTAVGEMFLRMGREDEARRVFSELVEFSPLDALARRRLGDLYRAYGWYQDAYRQYQTLHDEILIDDDGVKLLMAQAAAGAGRTLEALQLEQRVMENAQAGATQGLSRTALLWSSVRYARMRNEARTSGDDEALEDLTRRMRRSAVLREKGPLRVTLVWSHPDAGLSLWAGFPGLSLTRPTDINPEYGIEAFHLEEQEPSQYRFEVRRTAGEDNMTEIQAQLVVLWNEGLDDEQVEIIDLTFDRSRNNYAWSLTGRALTQTSPGEGR